MVTGAATGIGRASALALAASGARVAVNHLGKHELATSVVNDIEDQGGTAIVIEADVSDRTQVRHMFSACEDQLGAPTVLINNAGVILEQAFLERTEDEWDDVMNTDLKSVFLCCQAALPAMLAAGKGCIINIASELGYLGRAHYTAYTAAKGGVITLTRSLAREFAPAIRVNAIAPGPVATPMLDPAWMSPQVIAAESDIPAQRLGRPEEIAASVVFLASAQAEFFHGQVLSPNGGACMF